MNETLVTSTSKLKKPYLVLVNGILAARHVTRLGALRHIGQLEAKGIKAVIAYKLKEQA